MRHLVITMSMYGPEVDQAWNQHRVSMVRQNSAPSINAQTADFEWVVLLHPADPLLEDRRQAFSGARFAYFDPEGERRTDDPDGRVNPQANGALIENWRQVSYRVDRIIHPIMGEHDEPLLLTRFDDDDAFAVDALARIQDGAGSDDEPVVLMQPEGYVVWATPPPEIQPFRHPANGFSTIQAPRGSRVHPYTYGHNRVVDHLPVRIVDEEPAWLMFRHEENMSVFRRKHARDAARHRRVMGTGGATGNMLTFAKPMPMRAALTPAFRRRFPLDWKRRW